MTPIDTIAIQIAQARNCPLVWIFGLSRLPGHVRVRQEVMARAHAEGHHPEAIAGALGRERTTILHGIRAHQARLNGRVDQRKFNGGANVR